MSIKISIIAMHHSNTEARNDNIFSESKINLKKIQWRQCERFGHERFENVGSVLGRHPG